MKKNITMYIVAGLAFAVLALIITFINYNNSRGKDTKAVEGTLIELSDGTIRVDGMKISTDKSAPVYAGAEIIYYKENQDSTYGEGRESDSHNEIEAGNATAITITMPGVYTVTGKISDGQIVVDLGDDAKTNPEKRVELILDNANIECDIAPAILVLNAYECSSSKQEMASYENDVTESAGFRLIIADDSENTIEGSYVAKIYKDGTTEEDIENGSAKKKYKFDGAISSRVSLEIDGQESKNGRLTVNADLEGISPDLHLTINGGVIDINAADDSINASEDDMSVVTINGGTISCNSGLGHEGDGIDSNGWIVINGGIILSCANANSMDAGLDSGKGTYINGGIVVGTGHMYDEILEDSAQQFIVFSPKSQESSSDVESDSSDEKQQGRPGRMNNASAIEAGQIVLVTDENDHPIIAFSASNAYGLAVVSCPDIVTENYKLYKVDKVLGDKTENKLGCIYTNITAYDNEEAIEYSDGATTMMGPGGAGGMRPNGFGKREHPDGFDGQGRPERPEGFDGREPKEFQENFNGQQPPEPPEGFDDQMPQMDNME